MAMEVEVSAKRGPSSPPHIPIEIIRCILKKLKVKALIRSQCVCKEWSSIKEDDPDLKLSYRGPRRVLVMASGRMLFADSSITIIKTLFHEVGDDDNNYPLAPSLTLQSHYWWTGVWCSCNGLVLFSVGKHILLWNPSTRCCTKVLELQHLKYHHNVASGLCYVPSTGDYKAVLLPRPDGTVVLVASLKNKEWLQVLFPYQATSVRDSGVNFRNTLHWRVSDFRDSCFTRRCEKVVYFEAESNEFKELPIPTFPRESCGIRGLGIIDGRLSLARERKRGIGEVQVLVMKEYGVKESWVSLFVISASQFRSDYHRDFTFYSSNDGAKVLISSCLYALGRILVYDLKNNQLENCAVDSGHHIAIAAICLNLFG